MITTNSKTVNIESAEHIGGYRLRLRFSDGEVVEVDFESFLRAATHPDIRRYLQPRHFKQFRITDGVLEWNDFDLIFPMADLYKGAIR